MGERLASGDAWEALEHWAKAKGMTWSSWKVLLCVFVCVCVCVCV